MGHEKRDMAIRTAIGHAILERAEADARRHGVREIRTVLENGEPTARIIQTATDEGVNLIVLGSRGIGNLVGIFGGSLSNRVNHLSDITVVTVN